MADELEFDDVELTYEIAGHGERVVLVHAAPFVSWYRPLVERLRPSRSCTTDAACEVMAVVRFAR